MRLQATSFMQAWTVFRTRRVFYLVLVMMIFSSCLAGANSSVDPQLRESIRWYTGETGTVNDGKAKQLLELAAADSDPLSTMWIARVHSTGRMGYPLNKVHAQIIANSVIEQVEIMAGAGVPEAQFLMGTAYAEALGQTRNDQLAAVWYLRAAENGHVLAAHNMGNIHYSGTGVAQDDVLAVHWWSVAAQAGDAIPQYRLGEMYEQGRGVEKNLKQASYWYQESALRGYANAADALNRLEVPVR